MVIKRRKEKTVNMKQDIITFEDYDITIDEEEIKNMSKQELIKCKEKIQEIQNLLENK